MSRGGTAGLRHVDDCRSSSFVAFVFPSAFPLSCLCLPFCISCLSSLLWFLVSVLLWSLCLVFIFPFAFPGCLPFCVSLCLSFCVPFVLSMSSLLRFLLVLPFCASLCRSFCVPCVCQHSPPVFQVTIRFPGPRIWFLSARRRRIRGLLHQRELGFVVLPMGSASHLSLVHFLRFARPCAISE